MEVQNNMTGNYVNADVNVKEPDKNNTNIDTSDNKLTGSKETEDQRKTIFAADSDRKSRVESDTNLQNELDRMTEDSFEANGTDNLNITTDENKSEQCVVDAQILPDSIDEENSKLPENYTDNINIGCEIVPSKRHETDSDIISQSTGLVKTKITILQDVKLKSNIAKHLLIPTPITSKKRKEVDPQPSATSSPKYRQYLENKAAKPITDKKKKNKPNKENKSKKKKHSNVYTENNKSKEHCWGCKEELDSDLDEGDAGHVGCDNCPRWYCKYDGIDDIDGKKTAHIHSRHFHSTKVP